MTAEMSPTLPVTVHLLGTGGPRVDPQRAGPATLGRTALID